jgi:hypothetical protein
MSHFIFAIRHLCASLFEQFNRSARTVNGHHLILRAMRHKNFFPASGFLK